MGFLQPYIKLIQAVLAVIVFLVIAGGLWYISSIKANLAISEANNATLTKSVQDQKKVIEKQANDMISIQISNKVLADIKESQQKEIDDLNEKFNINARGQSRDLGAITRVKPGLVNKIVNKATAKVNRCFELATGAELKEGEKNNECKELVADLSK